MTICLRGYAYPLKHGMIFFMKQSNHSHRPRDANQLAKMILDIATGEQPDRLVTEDGRDLAAVLLGRKGGLKGGPARAGTLSPVRRKEIASQAAKARWGKK